MNIPEYADAFMVSQEMMREAYHKIPDAYWKERNACKFEFDNFAQLVELRQPAGALGSSSSARRLLENTFASADRVAVYAGIPWCVQTCNFCDLAYGRNPSRLQEEQYVDLLVQEISQLAQLGLKDMAASSLYFGGGTPSVLNIDLLKKLIVSVSSFLKLEDRTVITCECSPATITAKKLEAIRPLVNRISLGVQTFSTPIRKRIGRILSREKCLEKIRLATAQFDLVNIDLIYGLEGQTEQDVYDSIKDAIELGVPSITFYRLEVPKGVPIESKAKEQPWLSIQEQYCRRYYFLGKYLLVSAGYYESPLGWFVKSTCGPVKTMWSKMVSSWGSVTPYIGIGQGSFSTSDQFWMRNSKQFSTWSNAVLAGNFDVPQLYVLNPIDKFLVRFMRLIRSVEFFDREFLSSQFPGPRGRIEQFFDTLMDFALVVTCGSTKLRLTTAGESLVHWIIADANQLLSQVNIESNEYALEAT